MGLTRESTALSPVCIGSCTDFLGMIPGAFNSILWRVSDSIGPFPSMAFPSGSTTRPSIPSPMGTSTIDPVLLTISPSWISLVTETLWDSEWSCDWELYYLPIVTKDDNTDVVSLQVQSHTLDSGLELNHLSGLDLGQSKDSCNTISNGDNRSKFFQVILQKSKS